MAVNGNSPRWPAVILVGIDTPIGLTVIRELGAHGVPVIGVGRSAHAIGRYSRYLAEFVQRPAADVALAEWLPALAERTGARIVMAISESDLMALDASRERLAGLQLLIPPSRALAIVLDKRRTLVEARALGLTVPREYDPRNLLASPQTLDDVRFPVVLKWPDPNAMAAVLRRAGLELRKAEFCRSPAELRAALQRYAQLDAYPLVQQYVRGHGLGQMVLMHRGQPVLRFQHRRLHEWPPEGGVSTWCEALDERAHHDLMQASIELLRTIGWEGPAMVEYRFDPATRQAVLMEINGRFWGSLPLASLAGAPFAWGAYLAMGLDRPLEGVRVLAGLRARFMIPETRRLLRVLFRSSAIADPLYENRPWRDLCAYVASFLDPRERYFVFRMSDPMPFFADLWHAVSGAIAVRGGTR